MKSVFMGKDVAQWLMKSINQIVIGISSKKFYRFREGDLAYTFHWSSNSFGLFLLLTKFKVGRFRNPLLFQKAEQRMNGGYLG